MPENLSRFSKVPRQEPVYTPPFVPADEIKPISDPDTEVEDRESEKADDIALLMDTGPKPGESQVAYQERLRVYRQGLKTDDHMDAKYPPSSVTRH